MLLERGGGARRPISQDPLYPDAKWFPEGIPVVFYSMHATKADRAT